MSNSVFKVTRIIYIYYSDVDCHIFGSDFANYEASSVKLPGEYTFGLGYWDYCLYLDRQKPDYVSLTWQEKRDMLWSKIKEDQSISRYYSEVKRI